MIERIKRNTPSVSLASRILEKIVGFSITFTAVALLDWLILFGLEQIFGLAIKASAMKACLMMAACGAIVIAGIVSLCAIAFLSTLVIAVIGYVADRLTDWWYDHHQE